MSSNDDGSSSTPSSTTQPQQSLPSYEELLSELNALKTKTKSWKSTVKAQLDEASSKNAYLREELKKSHEAYDRDMAALRVELSREFRERTEQRELECQNLEQEVRAWKTKYSQQEIAHAEAQASAVKAAEELLNIQHRQDLEKELAQREEQARLAAQTQRLLEAQKDALDHDKAVLSLRVTSLAEQLRARDEASSDSAIQQPIAGAEADAKRRLELVEEREAKSRVQHDEALARAEGEHRRREEALQESLQRREEQLLTVQTILKQSQHDAVVVQDHWLRAQQQLTALQSNYQASFLQLQRELAAVKESEHVAGLRLQHVEAEYLRAKAQVAELEESNLFRDEALRASVFGGDEHKGLVVQLQASLQRAQDDATMWSTKFQELQSRISEREAKVAHDAEELERNQQNHERLLQQLHEANEKRSQQERKLLEQKLELVAKAKELHASSSAGGGSSTHPGRHPLQLPTLSTESSFLVVGGEGLEEGTDVYGSARTASSGSGLAAANAAVRNVMQHIRHGVTEIKSNYHRAIERSQGSRRDAAALLLRHYRNVLPYLLLALFLIVIVFNQRLWASSGAGSSASSILPAAASAHSAEEAELLKQSFHKLRRRFEVCCPADLKDANPSIVGASSDVAWLQSLNVSNW